MDEDYVGSKTRSGNGHGAHGFVDADGDGINDNAVDSDGDGIPNGQDEDYVRPEDGTGNMHKYGKSNMKQNKNMKGDGSGMGSGDCDGSGSKGSKGGKKQGGRK